MEPSKTGTSTFQYQANKLLKNENFYFPKACQWMSDNSHHPLVFSFFGINQWGNVKTSYKSLLNKMRKEIEELNFLPKTLVLSYEEIAYKSNIQDFFNYLAKYQYPNRQSEIFFCRNCEESY